MYTGLLRGVWFQSHVAHYKAVISLVDRTLDFQKSRFSSGSATNFNIYITKYRFDGLSSNGKTHGFDPCIVGSNPTSPACL